MKSAYFWIQLQSNTQHKSRQTHYPSITSELTESEIIRSGLIERFSNAVESALINTRQFLRDKLNQSPKLKIRSYSDSQGNTWWHVYDPITKETGYLHSEAEVQDWLEQHYYREQTRSFN